MGVKHRNQNISRSKYFCNTEIKIFLNKIFLQHRNQNISKSKYFCNTQIKIFPNQNISATQKSKYFQIKIFLDATQKSRYFQIKIFLQHGNQNISKSKYFCN